MPEPVWRAGRSRHAHIIHSRRRCGLGGADAVDAGARRARRLAALGGEVVQTFIYGIYRGKARRKLRARGRAPPAHTRPSSLRDGRVAVALRRCSPGAQGGVARPRHAPSRFCSCSPRVGAPPASWARPPCRCVPATRATSGRRYVAKRVQARSRPPLRERRGIRERAPALCGCRKQLRATFGVLAPGLAWARPAPRRLCGVGYALNRPPPARSLVSLRAAPWT